MASILTNAGALTALRVLEQTNRALGTTQDRISTGLKVATAKDNASFWSVAATMKSDVAAFKSITDNLSLASNAASVARDGAQQISELIKEIKQKATSAQEGALDKGKMQRDIDDALSQIDEIVNSAQFNGVNLLADSKEMRYLSSIVRGDGVAPSYIRFDTQDLSRSGNLSMLDGLSVLGRGDSLVSDMRDGSVTTEFALDTSANNGDTPNGSFHIGESGLQKGGKLTFSYKDAAGVTRTVDVTTTKNIGTGRAGAEEFVAQLNANSQISSNFIVEVNQAGNIQITQRNREAGISFTSLKADGLAVAGSTDAANNPNASAEFLAVNQKQQMTLNFQDAPLRLNEEISLTVKLAGVDYEMVFRVTDGDKSSGDLLDASGNKIVVALDAREVTGSFTTGEKIASELNKAFGKIDYDNSGTSNYVVGNGVTAEMVAAAEAIQDAVFGETDLALAVDGTDKNKLTLSFAQASADASNGLVGATLPQTDYAAVLKNVDAALEVALNAAASLGSAQKRIEIQQDFLKSMVDNLNIGIGTLVDANMNEESARLQALQVQQQLGIQALSIANQSPQALLSLFR